MHKIMLWKWKIPHTDSDKGNETRAVVAYVIYSFSNLLPPNLNLTPFEQGPHVSVWTTLDPSNGAQFGKIGLELG
jgi:hypothetical protein